ncbi:hypothetical protein BDV3_001438 [Batrachochytrium dendrobatidis]|nr:hypothetical protein O5D80_000585 [Batrachochytrium dendrobatidis]KAK5672135.1 hypothetical protein QVD99_001941 [Batrachochytrium dendrobatidis]
MALSLLMTLADAADQAVPLSASETAALCALQRLALMSRPATSIAKLPSKHSTKTSTTSVKVDVSNAAVLCSTRPTRIQPHSFPGANSHLDSSSSLCSMTHSSVDGIQSPKPGMLDYIPATSPDNGNAGLVSRYAASCIASPAIPTRQLQLNRSTLRKIPSYSSLVMLTSVASPSSLPTATSSQQQLPRSAESGLDLLTDAMLDDIDLSLTSHSISHLVSNYKQDQHRLSKMADSTLLTSASKSDFSITAHVCMQCNHRGSLVTPSHSAMKQSRGQLMLETRRQQLSISLAQRIAAEEARLRLVPASPERLVALDRLMRMRARKNSLLMAARQLRSVNQPSSSVSTVGTSSPSSSQRLVKMTKTVVAIPPFVRKSQSNQNPSTSTSKQNCSKPPTLLLSSTRRVTISSTKPPGRDSIPILPVTNSCPIKRYYCSSLASR